MFVVDVGCHVRPLYPQLVRLSFRNRRQIARPFNVFSRAASTASESRSYARRQPRLLSYRPDGGVCNVIGSLGVADNQWLVWR